MANPTFQGGALELRFPDIVSMWKQSVERFGASPLYGVRGADKTWTWLTYAEVSKRVHIAAAALRTLGVEPGDRVAVIANNRLEWAIACYATYGRGAAYVPMYEQQLDRDWAHILRDSGAKVVLVANDKIAARVEAIRGEAPALRELVILDDGSGDAKRWSTLMKEHATASLPLTIPAAEALATIIYTSGTTGVPKGVRLTHHNLASNVCGGLADIPLGPDDRTLAFLPWAHVLGGSIELHGVASAGASTAICEKVEQLIEMIPEVRPTLLVAVPRIWNRIYAGLNKQVSERPRAVQQVFMRAVAVATKKARGEAVGLFDTFALWLARKLIFEKVLERLGGRLRYAVTGSAAISREVADFIDALGVTVFEGYGLSECAGVATVNNLAGRRMGSVGRPIRGAAIEIDLNVEGADQESGEIIVHSPGNTSGYNNLPDESKTLFTASGGLRTGDLGRLDDGYLYITGRVKELYKLENGKYVAPAPLEEKLQLSPYIAQVMVFGADRPHNVALIVPAFDRLREWAKAQGAPTEVSSLVKDAKVKELLKAELARLSDDWKGYEKVRDFLLIADAFSTENDLLTVSLKVKRRNVVKRYERELTQLYAK